MVQVRQKYSVTEAGDIDLDSWAHRVIDAAQLPHSSLPILLQVAGEAQRVEQQVLTGDNSWSDNADSFITGLEMAEILAKLRLDLDALIAAVIYRSVREKKMTLETVNKHFGEPVAKLVDGVLRMAAIQGLRNDEDREVLGKQSAEQFETVRKMLIAMVDDVRIALIKLSERTCAIRAAKHAGDASRRKVAREVSEIYAPLAHRLGIGHIKWELEDLAFRYLRPDEYKNIAQLLDEKRLSRQTYIDKVVKALTTQIKKSHIDASVVGRAKHLYSIWRKMQRKGISFSEVYDIRAVRILVPTTRDCYEVLGIVHTMWRNIPNEFDDYIAAPKENGYRSLHTAVFGPESKVLEVQIRSQAMHDEAEFGVCSHWRYKGTDTPKNGQQADSYEKKIEWLRQVLEWHEEWRGEWHEKLGENPLADDLTSSIEQDRIYLFTPEGHIVDLPQGSTPLDFAYRIHTEIGHRCRGAKVNGRIVPLNHILQTAEQVEVLTGKQEIPSRDWLNDGLGYLKTARARAKVRQWFGARARAQNIADGRVLLDRELKRLGIKELNFEALVSSLNLAQLDELYANLGASEMSVGHVVAAVQKQIAPLDEPKIHLVNKPAPTSGNDIFIEGVGNLVTVIANCCHPVPGDEISGYITLGRGVSIHRKDCHNLLQLQTDEPERIIQVSWGEAPKQQYTVDIMVEAYDRKGLLRDIAVLLDNARINVTAMQTLSDKGQHTVDMVITIEIGDFTELSKVLARINQLPNIASARRRHS